MIFVNKFRVAFILIIVISLFFSENGYALVGAAKNIYEISLEVIKSLAVTGKTKGSASVAKELSKIALKVPPAQRAKFFESAYAKILVEQGRISHTQADEWVKNLASVPGFRSTLSKMVGSSDSKYVGHFFELSMANQLSKNGYKVMSIGEKYNDTIKLVATDIDLIATKGSRTFAFELKNYNPNKITVKEVNEFERDMQTLKVYASEHKDLIPVFLSKNAPADPAMKAVLNAYGQKNGVKVLYGEPEIAVHALEVLR